MTKKSYFPQTCHLFGVYKNNLTRISKFVGGHFILLNGREKNCYVKVVNTVSNHLLFVIDVILHFTQTQCADTGESSNSTQKPLGQPGNRTQDFLHC